MKEAVGATKGGYAVGALSIMRSVVLKAGNDQIQFSVDADATADKRDLFGLLDTIGELADREKWKGQLVEKREALVIARRQPELMRREIAATQARKAGYEAMQLAKHRRSGRAARGNEWQPNEAQQGELDKFDQAIGAAEGSIANFVKDIPLIEWEVKRLEALIAGETPPPPPPEMDMAIHDIMYRTAAE